MIEHPERKMFFDRVSSRLETLTDTYRGSIYRFLKPKYSTTTEQFSGKGALHVGGRWMIQADKCVAYSSLLPETALLETLASNRYYGLPDRTASPLLFVTAEVRLRTVVDLRNGNIRRRLQLSEESILHTDWRKINSLGHEAVTQAWGWAFHLAGIEALLCRSAAHPGGENVIIFPRNLGPGSRIRVLNEIQWPRQ